MFYVQIEDEIMEKLAATEANYKLQEQLEEVMRERDKYRAAGFWTRLRWLFTGVE